MMLLQLKVLCLTGLLLHAVCPAQLPPMLARRSTNETNTVNIYSDVSTYVNLAAITNSALKFASDIATAKKVLEFMAGASKFLSAAGMIFDLIMIFLPASESAELLAIKAGFAEVDAKIDVLSDDLEDISDRLDWTTVANRLVGFESSVKAGMETYADLEKYIKETADFSDIESGKLSTSGKVILEHLINYVENNNFAQLITEIMTLVRGESKVIDKPLLSIFEVAADHNCSKILPFSSGLFTTLQNAQKLKYFYDINQGTVAFDDDDQEYQEQLHYFLSSSTNQLAYCMKNAVETGEEDLRSIIENHGIDDHSQIIKTLGEKYYLYKWATLKEDDYDESQFAFYQNLNQMIEADKSEEEKERVTVFMTPKSNVAEIKSASISVLNRLDVELNLSQYSGPRVVRAVKGMQDAFYYEKMSRSDLDKIIHLILQKEGIQKEAIQTMVLLENYGSLSMAGWHYTQPLYLSCRYDSVNQCGIRGRTNAPESDVAKGEYITMAKLKLGVLFNNLDSSTLNYNCNNGEKIQLSASLNHPYCICDIEFGGENCQIPKSALMIPSQDTYYDIISKYRVPGMFDLQDQIEDVSNEIMAEMEQNKEEIFSEIEENGNDIVQNRNAILASQSIILNQYKNESARLLQEFAGLKNAMEEYYTKQRNDMIFSTQEAQTKIVNAIMKSSIEITSSLLRMDGQLIENRYFDELKLHLPVFQDKFAYATRNDAMERAKEEFSDYLDDNMHDFNVARAAIEHAIIGSSNSDSFIVAQMRISMTDGCTTQYHQHINSTWAELLALHESTYMMELWDLDYRIKKLDSAEIEDKLYLERLEETRETEALSELENFVEVYNERSCLGFNMPQLSGGGCEDSSTYPNQKIPLHCADSSQSVVRSTTNEVITEITCKEDFVWDVNINDLECVSNCEYNGETYALGTTRILPDPSSGFQWVDETETVITETRCISSNTDAQETTWSFHQSSDINECDSVNCGHGQCTNTDGSYTCNCDEGFYENSLKVCEDVNECSSGGIGYTACQLGSMLGQCTNTVGSYRCSCLTGAYAPGGSLQSCQACECNENGVTRDYCDASGHCTCKSNVGGNTCDRCDEGYDNFPSCSSCDVGYYGYPDCRNCNCNLNGVSTDICNKISGRCDCQPDDKYFGTQCSRCCPQSNCDNDYIVALEKKLQIKGKKIKKKKTKNANYNIAIGSNNLKLGSNNLKLGCTLCSNDYTAFPTCTPIISDVTLSSWSSWSSWTNVGSCSTAYGLYRTRYRTRTCDASTRNIHGNTCSDFELRETAKDNSRRCYSVNKIQIRVADHSWSGTSGKLRVNINQAGRECLTHYPTYNGAKTGWHTVYGNNGCGTMFDVNRGMLVRLISDSGDDCYIDRFYVFFDDGTKMSAYISGRSVKYNKHSNAKPWLNAYSS